MKKIFILLSMFFTLLSCSSLHSPAELDAIENTKRCCKFPLTFELNSVKSTYHKTDTFLEKRYVVFGKGKYDFDSKYETEKRELKYKWEEWHCKDIAILDSIRIYEITLAAPAYYIIEVRGSAKNAFGVPQEIKEYWYASSNSSKVTSFHVEEDTLKSNYSQTLLPQVKLKKYHIGYRGIRLDSLLTDCKVKDLKN